MSTGLAAVNAAAESVSRSDHDAAVAKARADGKAEGVAEATAAGRREGADAERTRIAGIQAHAIKGHEALIAACIADGACSPDMAAGRILAAEKKLRDAQMAGVAGVEAVTGKVAAAPTSQPNPPATGAEKATTPDGWKAEYEASAELRAEFATLGDYVALKAAEASGKVKVFAPGAGRR
jgi:hypothetical protein